MRDNLFAEARCANEDRDFAYALPRRCGNFKSALYRFVRIIVLRLHAQQSIHEVVKLDLVSAYIKEYIIIIFK